MSDAYVVDSSALMQGFVADTFTNQIQSLLARLGQPDPPELHFLEIGLVESTNVLWKRVRFSGVPADKAARALKDMISLPLVIHSVGGLLQESLEIGLDHQIAIYDAAYIALAHSTEIPLITADQRQAQVAESVGVSLKPITDFAPSQPAP